MSIKERKEKGRSYLPALILSLVWWGLLGGLVFLVDPAAVADWPVTRSYFSFFLLLFLAVLFSASLLLGNTRRGLVVAVGFVVYGYLRLLKLGGIVNLILLLGALLAFEVYFSWKDKGVGEKGDSLVD